MALKIVWTKRARSKFDQIITRLVEEWGEKSAKQFIGKKRSDTIGSLCFGKDRRKNLYATENDLLKI